MPPPTTAPRGLTVHGETALENIDPKQYPQWPNHYAITVDAFRALLLKNISSNKLAADAVTTEIGARRLAEEQRDSALKQAAHAAWMATWGPWLGVGATLLTEALLAGIVLSLVHH